MRISQRAEKYRKYFKYTLQLHIELESKGYEVPDEFSNCQNDQERSAKTHMIHAKIENKFAQTVY